jgi:uncharacterized protein (TIGR03905 family)
MTKVYTHKCVGTCSSFIELEYDDKTEVISSCKIFGGCPGNTQGVSRLVVNRTLNEIHDLLIGTMCGRRGTSCPNELAKAIEEIKSLNKATL